MIECLESIGFSRSQVDPCLFIKKDENGVVYLAIYVDDCYAVGDLKAIERVIKDIVSTGYTVKVEDDLSDYLSCKIIFDKEKKKAWLGQPHLIKNLETKFGEDVKGLQRYNTPGTPRQGIRRIVDGPGKLSVEDHKIYRSGVGMLLYLVKHSRQGISRTLFWNYLKRSTEPHNPLSRR